MTLALPFETREAVAVAVAAAGLGSFIFGLISTFTLVGTGGVVSVTGFCSSAPALPFGFGGPFGEIPATSPDIGLIPALGFRIETSTHSISCIPVILTFVLGTSSLAPLALPFPASRTLRRMSSKPTSPVVSVPEPVKYLYVFAPFAALACSMSWVEPRFVPASALLKTSSICVSMTPSLIFPVYLTPVLPLILIVLPARGVTLLLTFNVLPKRILTFCSGMYVTTYWIPVFLPIILPVPRVYPFVPAAGPLVI